MQTVFEACNFQDLTGQRISKVVRTVCLVEERVAEMLHLWAGPAGSTAPVASLTPATAKPAGRGRGDEDGLLNGPACPAPPPSPRTLSMLCSVEPVTAGLRKPMGRMLVITDDPHRSTGLAQELAADAPFKLLDLYDGTTPIEAASAIVVDILDLRSDTIARLRRLLDKTVRSGPLVMLLHKDAPRSRILAVALGASQTLCQPFDIPRLRAALALQACVPDPEPLPQCVVAVAGEARSFLTTVFVPGRPITPSIVNTGSDFIGTAIQETGIRDWVRPVHRFDDVTHQHCLLVAGLAAAFAASLGLGEGESTA